MLTKEHIKTLEGLHSLAESRGDIAAAEALTALLETVRALPETADGVKIAPLTKLYHRLRPREPYIALAVSRSANVAVGRGEYVNPAECYSTPEAAAAALQEQQQ